ncbi:MAG: VWA domain-containing protein [Actinobacteria bacterium]|nr:VWA domain-containing protein [Actinomycetota bacterium]
MERSLHRFVRILRLRGVRVSVTETLDAMRAAAQRGALADRETLRCVLRVALVKDRRDEEVFDELFDRYFRLEPVAAPERHGHGHGHDDLADQGAAESFTISPEVSQTPQQGHSHGKPADIRDYFRPEDLATAYNLHQEASKIDLASMTDEIVLAKERGGAALSGPRIQLDTSRLHAAGAPGKLISSPGTRLDADLTVAEELALLGWLEDPDAEVPTSEIAALARGSGGQIANLGELLKRHLAALAAMDRTAIESPQQHSIRTAAVGEAERYRLEETLRRLAKTMPGALTHRRTVAGRGRVDPGRTMRANMRFDGIPFRPVTVARKEDKPRLVVLADVSLSVRHTARFTLYFVHGLQRLFGQVRTFAFVAGTTEVTDLFAEHPVERALEEIFAGDVLDVAADSDYGTAFGEFREEFPDVVTRRTTVVILGDGRGNGHDANMEAFEELARRSKQLIWLTPERRSMWRLGHCDLPRYAEFCDRVDVVRDLDGLDRATHDIVAGLAGR